MSLHFRTMLCCLLFSSPNVFAASDMKPLEKFDIYAAPLVGLTTGTFKADDSVEGTQSSFQLGARAGFKLGPVLLGGEFGAVYSVRDSKGEISDANSEKYASDKGTTLTMAGVNLGWASDRWVLWATYYPVSSLESTVNLSGGGTSKNTYTGYGVSSELTFRVWNRLYLGAMVMQHEFSKYKMEKTNPVDSDLSPTLKVLSYGLSISYIIPFSEFGKLPSIFPKM